MQSLGAVVTELRGRRGWTQEELAQRLGVSAQAVSKWETGQSMPDVALLLPLAQALGCTVDELLTGSAASLRLQGAEPTTGELVPEEQRARNVVVRVEHPASKPVTVRLPIGLLRFGVKLWSSFPALATIPDADKEVLLDHIERGLIGEVVRVEPADGSVVTVTLE